MSSSRLSPNQTIYGRNNPPHAGLLHLGSSSTGISDDNSFGSNSLINAFNYPSV